MTTAEQSLLPLSPAEKALIFAFREIVREALTEVGPPKTPREEAFDRVRIIAGGGGEICRASGAKGTVCIRPVGHRERHRYGNPPAARTAPPARNWEPIGDFPLLSGSRTYTIGVGHPVKVKPKPIGSPGQDGWKVMAIEHHTETGKINVTVSHAGDPRSRVVPADQIVYKRPKKVFS